MMFFNIFLFYIWCKIQPSQALLGAWSNALANEIKFCIRSNGNLFQPAERCQAKSDRCGQ
jgi:hypothetical protein